MIRVTSSYTNACDMPVITNQSPMSAARIWLASVELMPGTFRFTVTEGQRAWFRVPMFATHAATPVSMPSVWTFTVTSDWYLPIPAGESWVDIGPVSTLTSADPP